MDENGQPYANAIQQMEESYAGQIGKAIEPVLAPLGFDWQTGIALVAGFAAKEVVVSTLGTLYSIGDEEALAEVKQPLPRTLPREPGNNRGLLLYCLYINAVYPPVFALCGCYRGNKTRNQRMEMAFIHLAYTTALAWIVCFLVYQGGRLVGLA